MSFRKPSCTSSQTTTVGLQSVAVLTARYRGAGEGIRTLDVNLGKVALYH